MEGIKSMIKANFMNLKVSFFMIIGRYFIITILKYRKFYQKTKITMLGAHKHCQSQSLSYQLPKITRCLGTIKIRTFWENF